MARSLAPVEPTAADLAKWAGVENPPPGFTDDIARWAIERYARACVRPPVVWAIPTRGHPSARWMQGFWKMYRHPDDVVWFNEGTLVDSQRNALVEEFLKTPLQWLLQWDDDVVVLEQNVDVVARMLRTAREFDTKIVSGVYVQKKKPYIPHVYQDITEDPDEERRLYTPITEYAGGSVLEVDGVGGGFLLVHRSVYEQMADPTDRKWFTFRFGFGEDLAFCHQAKQAGFRIYADTSIKLGHITYEALNLNHYVAHQLRMREGDEGVKQAFEDQKQRMADRGNGLPSHDAIEELFQLGVRHWKAFEGLTDAEVQERFKEPADAVAAEWNGQGPQTASEYDEFYRETKNYIPDLLLWNRSQAYVNKIYKAMRWNAVRVADFGGGIGTLSILFARQNRQVFYVDVPGHTRDFAEFRFRDMGLLAGEDAAAGLIRPITDLDGADNLDLITAIDVLEHIHPDDITYVAVSMAGALKPGGRLYHASSFLQIGETAVNHPMHLATEHLWQEAWVKYGLKRDSDDGTIWVKGDTGASS